MNVNIVIWIFQALQQACVAYALHKLQMTDTTLKTEQRSAMEAIYSCQDVFVWLPAGYGKSLRYQVPPFIMDYKHGVVDTQRPSLVLVVIDR